MDKLSVTEGLVAMLVERDNVDGTNAIILLRAAQEACCKVFGIGERKTGEHPISQKERWLNRRRDADQVDNIIILTTRNGQEDIFSA
jgi:hypothetical protein